MLCGRRCHLRITRRVVHRRNGIDETIGAQPAINTTALRSNCTRARPHRPLPYRFVLSRACAPREGTTERADGLRNFGLIPNGVSPGEAWRPGGSGSEDKRTSYCSRAWTGPSNTASDKVAVAGYRRTARRCRVYTNQQRWSSGLAPCIAPRCVRIPSNVRHAGKRKSKDRRTISNASSSGGPV